MSHSVKYSQITPQEEEDYHDAIELPNLPSPAIAAAVLDGSHDKNEDAEAKYGILELSSPLPFDSTEPFLQLHWLCNIAVPLNYFLVGLLQGMAYPFLNVYPLDLGATEAQQTTLLTLKSLPSCFKIAYGMLSDSVPIGGLRRKPYLYIGWLLSSLSLLPLFLLSDLTLISAHVNTDKSTTNTTAISTNITSASHWIAPTNAPSMPLLCGCFFLWANGLWMADVMGDALVAERAKYESTINRGNTQAICYILRGFGFVLVAPISSVLYSTQSNGPFLIVMATAMMPLLQIPAIMALEETPPTILMPVREQISALWNTACSPAVWQPMGFIFFYQASFVANSAWKQFLETCLHFTPNQLNALMILAGIMAFGGVVLYKLVLYKASWRKLYILSIALNAIVSAMQLLLISGRTFGLPPFIFALGDDSMSDLIQGVQYLPMVIMMVHLVPAGIEGSAYALFTTTMNVASSLAESMSTVLLGIWDVSKPTLARGDWSGLTRLTILTTALQTLPIVAVGLLPHSVEDLQHIQNESRHHQSGNSRYYYGGATYLLLVFLALFWTIFVDVMNIFHPGWMGES